MAYNSTTWSPDTLAKASETSSSTLNNATLNGTLTVGVNDTGYDVKFFGATSGQYLLWDESADELVLAGDSKLSFHDAAGGENIVASSDGHLEINAGTTLDITAPTVDINVSSELNIDGNVDLNGTLDVSSTTILNSSLTVEGTTTLNDDLTVAALSQFNQAINVGVDDTGYDVKFFGATSGKYLLWDASDDDLILVGANVALDASGNLSIAGDLTVTGGDIDLSGEKSTITLKDNQADALIIGGAGATTTLTVHTSDTVEHVEIITSRTSSAPEFAALDFTSTQILAGNINDSNSGGISFDPVMSGGHTVSRYNYLKFENPSLVLSAALTDACVMQFDANAGSHKAVDSGSAHPDIDTTDAWIKININGTIHYIPAYTDKS